MADEPSTTPESNPEPKLITQEDVTKIATQEQEKGKRQGARETAEKLAQELGMPLEDAKKALAAFREQQEQAKTEADRIREQAQEAQAERERLSTELSQERHRNLLLDRLEDAGVPKAARSRVAGLITSQVGASADEIDTDIEVLKAELPALFQSGKGRELPSSDPSGSPSKPKLTDDAYSKGAQRAAALKSA